MKKRFISKLLMAALVVVTMGVFSSCKDYDDDINANTALINQLQSQVKALEEAKADLTQKLNDANKAISDAQGDATKALNDIQTAKTELSKAISDGDNAAIEEAQKRINTAEQRILESAQTIAENEAAKAAATAKQEMLDELTKKVNDLNVAINARLTKEEFETVLATLATKEGLQAAIDPLAKGISDLQDGLKNNAEADAKVKELVDELYADAVRKGAFNEAIADLTSQINGVDTKLSNLIDEKWLEANQTFATISALNQAWVQIRIDSVAIKNLDAWVKNFDEKVLPTLATKKELQDVTEQLTLLINGKVSQKDFDDAINTINETIKTLATKDEVKTQIQQAVEDITKKLQDEYTTTAELKTMLANLKGEITQEYTIDTKNKIDALRSELTGVIETKIAANNAILKGEIYGVVDQKINTALSKYTTTESLMSLLRGYVQQSTLQGTIDESIDKFYKEKLQDKMNEIDRVSQKLGDMEQQLITLATELGALVDFEIEEEGAASGRMKVGENAASGIDALVSLLKTMSAKIENIHAYVDQTFASVDEELDNITLFVTKNLTSLVYRPEAGESDDIAYLYGFPIIRAMLLEPQQVYQNFQFKVATPAAGATIDQNKRKLYYGDKWNYADTYQKSGNDLKSKQFDVVAKYWLNPSSTDITKYKWGFDEVAGKNVITRGNQDTCKAIISANVIGVDDKGILSVALKLKKGENVNDAKTVTEREGSYAWITTVALQAVRNDANIESADTVTSDYAIIVPDYMDDLLLAYNKYEAAAPHQKGNNKFHIQTEYANLMAENDLGIFSDSLEYNADDVVDLTKIDIHYNGDQGVMSHKDAIARGFSFEYEILTNKDIFDLDVQKDEKSGNETAATISLNKDKKVIASVGKVANVRVKLMADGACFAYGYISIIVTNVKKTVPVPVPNLVLQCPGDFQSKIKWSVLEDSIKKVVGPSFSFDNYQIDLTAALQKVDENGNALTTDIAASVLKKEKIDNVDYLTWTFTEELVKKLFYNTDNTAKYAYDENGKSTEQFIVNVNLKPIEGRPEVADVTLKVSLEGLIYPTANYTMDQRIERYWFKEFSDDIATAKEERYEVHANVDVVGQKQTVNSTLQADDDFFFDASSFFVKNEFQFVPTNPFNWASTINNEAPLYFDSNKYYVVPTVGTAINVDPADKEKDAIVNGASGAKYALYLTNAFSLKLMATKQLADGTYKTSADDQVVVELSDGDKVAPNKPGLKFHELVKFMGKRDDSYSYARDLLNYCRHNELLKNQTFTTHMIFADNNELSCLPIALGGNRTFDIRYLRPLSASKKLPKIIEDAVDGGTDATKIYLTDIASFEDWRKIKFTAENHMDYLYYYGVKKIVADFDKARTNLNGGANLFYDAATRTATEIDEDVLNATASKWPLITEVTSKLKFEPDAAAQTPASALNRTADYDEFKYTNCGYYEYQNNAGNVGTFQIYIPISIIYDWGQTKEEYVLVTIVRTMGQDITGRARQN